MSQQLILLPLDARPVCYQLPQQLAALSGLELVMPAASMLGHLKTPADIDALEAWLGEQFEQFPTAPLVFATDLMAYGGLIPSRVHQDVLETLQARLTRILNHRARGERPIYGFSSILRIPNYNNAEEEPGYWADYGEAIYKASCESHEQGNTQVAFANVPKEVAHDFLTRRATNFQLNDWLLSKLETGTLQGLIFAQDDTGATGLNVLEAQRLQLLAATNKLPAGVQTGADEIAAVLMSQLAIGLGEVRPKVAIKAFPEDCLSAIARFDGQPLLMVIANKIATCGAQYVETAEEADMLLYVNGPRAGVMGDHCEGVAPPAYTAEALNVLVASLASDLQKKPVVLADVAYANGSDPDLIDALLTAALPIEWLHGYAGWNTPGNAIGSALAMGCLAFWAQQQNRAFSAAHQKALFTRFVDDWAYQSQARQLLRQKVPISVLTQEELTAAMQPSIERLRPHFAESIDTLPRLSLPCGRYFEIQLDWQAQEAPVS